MFSTSNKNEAIKSINFNAYEQFGNNNATSSFDVTLNSFKSKPATLKEACDFDRRSSATSPISDMKGSKMTPRPLKKAWLYRHTGEDELENAKFDDMAQNGINSFDKTLTKNCTDSSLTTNLNSNFYFTNLGTEKLNGIIKNNILQKNCNTLMKNNDKTYARKLFEDRAAKQGIKRNIVTLDEASTDLLNKAKNIVINNSTIYDNDYISSKKEKKDVSLDYFKNEGKKDFKKSEFTFLQDGPCFQVAPKLSKCRECRWTQNQDMENVNNIFCRFFFFRKLRYTKNLTLATAGFSDPFDDPTKDDISIWTPKKETTLNLDITTSRFILSHVGDQFCDLVEQEKQAASLNKSDVVEVAWKKLVKGVREMCDVCETTLFNYHWTCGKCGFIVCLDCYKHRINDTGRLTADPERDYDEFNWLLCTNRTSHELRKLMLTQIIPADCLVQLGQSMHKIRSDLDMEQYCPCANDSIQKCDESIKKEEIEESLDSESTVKSEDADQMNNLEDDFFKFEKPTHSLWAFPQSDESASLKFRQMLLGSNTLPLTEPKIKISSSETFDLVTSRILAAQSSNSDINVAFKIIGHEGNGKKNKGLPPRIMTKAVSSILYPTTPHSWLCDGKLLRLLEANNSGNYEIFQEQWIRGQPVIVSNVSNLLDMNLWHPSTFAKDFGAQKNDLVNCMNGRTVPNQPMEKFWEGFEHFSKRLKDEDGNPMLLKLKDWPPGEDFAELLPTRFEDLMKALPLGEYTKRNGKLNLAGCLPDCFVRPDLGPKMYNAYGSALYQSKGTTNLHLDISDAVNVMVYVGIPKDADYEEHIKQAFAAIDEAGCDILTRRRVREKTELPGALWHIYAASDADKIRDLLNKVTLESGNRLEPHHDPIHDQNWYLDRYLRGRLYKEYGVEGYAIVQCWGDAVFIPAGAPHQVRNLHNCIKVAEDFVSPENVSICSRLTQEFRDLSDTHSNHEDKLQIKNIIYHAVKDSLAYLSGYSQSDDPLY
ncbi:LOW QUALITY PROTEIN: lysine-specific demethylase 3B [Ctenocephalides felis]|uniref:LOW QUALITY PROTEIN: lysine-specific demethylase 3B n=1 Tax=Ctenocephalides felis TaxID=7515 RepID=UPI000E6E41BD|nr:LOW QUALITY PROTEIN: lysine-specific demethylase 3B [Ctenocephalides felis]